MDSQYIRSQVNQNEKNREESYEDKLQEIKDRTLENVNAVKERVRGLVETTSAEGLRAFGERILDKHGLKKYYDAYKTGNTKPLEDDFNNVAQNIINDPRSQEALNKFNDLKERAIQAQNEFNEGKNTIQDRLARLQGGELQNLASEKVEEGLKGTDLHYDSELGKIIDRDEPTQEYDPNPLKEISKPSPLFKSIQDDEDERFFAQEGAGSTALDALRKSEEITRTGGAEIGGEIEPPSLELQVIPKTAQEVLGGRNPAQLTDLNRIRALGGRQPIKPNYELKTSDPQLSTILGKKDEVSQRGAYGYNVAPPQTEAEAQARSSNLLNEIQEVQNKRIGKTTIKKPTQVVQDLDEQFPSPPTIKPKTNLVNREVSSNEAINYRALTPSPPPKQTPKVEEPTEEVGQAPKPQVEEPQPQQIEPPQPTENPLDTTTESVSSDLESRLSKLKQGITTTAERVGEEEGGAEVGGEIASATGFNPIGDVVGGLVAVGGLLAGSGIFSKKPQVNIPKPPPIPSISAFSSELGGGNI